MNSLANIELVLLKACNNAGYYIEQIMPLKSNFESSERSDRTRIEGNEHIGFASSCAMVLSPKSDISSSYSNSIEAPQYTTNRSKHRTKHYIIHGRRG